MTELQYLDRGDGLRLAYRHRRGKGPTIVFLPGYMSDMDGTKAVALWEWAGAEGRPMARFDYSGCGASEGPFEDGTLDRWRDDALAMIDRVAQGPVVLVGSSMGGWLMLLAALARPERVKALVGVAAAPDFTNWGFTDEEKARIKACGRIEEPSEYDEAPYVTTLRFWESGERNRVLTDTIPIDVPVRLLHGHDDKDVPWPISAKLANTLRSDDVRTVLVKGGDHRLSRAQDLGLLLTTVAELLEAE